MPRAHAYAPSPVRWLAGSAILLLLGLAVCGPAPANHFGSVSTSPSTSKSAPAPSDPPLSFEDFQRRVYALFLCSAGDNTQEMQQGWGLPKSGYRGFDQRHAQPVIAAGFKRFHMHLPDGFHRPDKNARVLMPFDARVDSQEHGYQGARDFDWLCRRHPDVIWLHYFGSLDDADLRRRADAGRFSEWLDRLQRSVAHTIDLPNVEYGFDAATKWPADSPEWAWLVLLRNIKKTQGRDCFIEALPRIDRPNTHGWPVIALRSWYEKIQANPQWKWDLPLEDYPPDTRIHIMEVKRGGSHVLVNGKWRPNTNAFDEVATGIAEVLSKGDNYTVAIAVHTVVQQGRTARDLYHAVIAKMENTAPEQ